MIPLKTIPAYSLVSTAVSEAAVDISPPILLHCLVCEQSCLSGPHAAHKHTSLCWRGCQQRSSMGLLLLLSTSPSSAGTVITLNEINA